MDVDLPEEAVGVQDPTVDISPLPIDHKPKFWDEAMQIYQNSTPRFVNAAGTNVEGTKRPVFIAKDGQVPDRPIRTSLIATRWGENANSGTFWALDLNGERLIVTSSPNNGCLSGAKWIYRTWTGVKDVFEDLPVAFTCINGVYPKKTATVRVPVQKQHTASDDTIDSTIAHIVRDGYTPHLTPLHENHPVEYLDEARVSYLDSKPPFGVLRNKQLYRPVRLAIEGGRFLATSTEAQVVYRAWDQRYDYLTLDLDGKRLIVIGSPGGPIGYQYHLWLGSKVGRIKKAVAFAGSYSKISSSLPERVAEIGENSSLLSPSDDEGDQDFQASPTADSQYSYDKFAKAFDVNSTPSSAPDLFHKTQSVSLPERTERNQFQLNLRERKHTKRTRSPSPPPHHQSTKGRTRAKSQKRTPQRSRQNRHLSDDANSLANDLFQAPTPSPSSNERSILESQAQNIPTQPPASLPNLTLHQQTHTTLRVTRDSNIIGFVPIRLLACMTMTALFNSVITASGHHEAEEPIKYLMAVFDWKDDDDLYKTIHIDRGTESSFEIFLEIIDEAPCWKEQGGKCGIAIEIVRN